MKKISILSLLFAFVLSGVILSSSEAMAKNTKKAGTVIKGRGLSTLYYIGEDEKRYVFPNDKTYFSWYDDFSEVEEVETSELYEYPLGGNARYKPGVLLIKVQTDPKVYAVGANGSLHWIKSEEIAKALYGDNWNKLIDDLPDSFFTNYEISSAVTSADDYDPITEEEENPTISENRGWKNRVAAVVRTQTEKMCGRLEGALTRLQKRMERLGFEVSNLGDDVLATCYGLNNDDSTNNEAPRATKKLTFCHNGNTISVGRAAARARFRLGDRLGTCSANDTNEATDETDESAPIISNIELSITANSADISWTTNENSDSVVIYSTSSLETASVTKTISSDILITTHSLELNGLAPSTTYYYIIKSSDNVGNTKESDENTFDTLIEAEEDVTAPVVSNIEITVSSTTMDITWNTDEGAKSLLRFALESLETASEVTTLENDDYLTEHSYSLNNLATSTEYFYTLTVKDAGDNTATSSEANFNTGI